MVNLLIDPAPPVAPATRRHPNLMLHCGANLVPRRVMEDTPTPRGTRTWTPIPHVQLVRQVERTLETNRLVIGTFVHSLSHDGARYFGLMEIQTQGGGGGDYCWVLGLRNSHDKTFPAGVVAGASVFVCDNLSFSGEVKLARKHTRFICRDLPMLVGRGIGRMLEKWHDQHTRFDAYKQRRLTNTTAHDLVIRATDAGVCSNRLIPDVLHQWREPLHGEFGARNVWSLFNAFTEALKTGNLAELPKRTEALHGLLDSHVGLASR
jgi:hypothetical protein